MQLKEQEGELRNKIFCFDNPLNSIHWSYCFVLMWVKRGDPNKSNALKLCFGYSDKQLLFTYVMLASTGNLASTGK